MDSDFNITFLHSHTNSSSTIESAPVSMFHYSLDFLLLERKMMNEPFYKSATICNKFSERSQGLNWFLKKIERSMQQANIVNTQYRHDL